MLAKDRLTVAPDRRKHRGPHPRDRSLFSAEHLRELQQATADLSWLLGRGYAYDASLKIVGDRYALRERQRIAVRRAACPARESASRRARQMDVAEVAPSRLVIDGFNVIVTVEAALSGGVLLRCCDGTVRDLASVHGSYRTVEETAVAVKTISDVLIAADLTEIDWFLDRPVSNSGRLAAILRAFADDQRLNWSVALSNNVDAELTGSSLPVATSDSVVLDRAGRWVNLAAGVVDQAVPRAWIVNLCPQNTQPKDRDISAPL